MRNSVKMRYLSQVCTKYHALLPSTTAILKWKRPLRKFSVHSTTAGKGLNAEALASVFRFDHVFHGGNKRYYFTQLYNSVLFKPSPSPSPAPLNNVDQKPVPVTWKVRYRISLKGRPRFTPQTNQSTRTPFCVPLPLAKIVYVFIFLEALCRQTTI